MSHISTHLLPIASALVVVHSPSDLRTSVGTLQRRIELRGGCWWLLEQLRDAECVSVGEPTRGFLRTHVFGGAGAVRFRVRDSQMAECSPAVARRPMLLTD